MQAAEKYDEPLDNTPRHARLFELIRQHNLTAMQASGAATRPDEARPASAESPRALTRDEQRALGITASFGR